MTHVCPHCEAILLPDERICPICGEGKDTAPAVATATDLHAKAVAPPDELIAVVPPRRNAMAPIGVVAAMAACMALVFVAYRNSVRHPSATAGNSTGAQSVSAKGADDPGPTPLLFSVHSTGGQTAVSPKSVKSTQAPAQQPASRGAQQPTGATYNAVTSAPLPGQAQPAPDASVPQAAPPPNAGGAPAAAPAQTDPRQAALTAMDQQLTDARARITTMTDARTQLNDRLQQLQANPPPDGAAIQRREYDQQVQALQQNIEQAQTAIDAAQSSVDALQQQRDRMAGQ